VWEFDKRERKMTRKGFKEQRGETESRCLMQLFAMDCTTREETKKNENRLKRHAAGYTLK